MCEDVMLTWCYTNSNHVLDNSMGVSTGTSVSEDNGGVSITLKTMVPVVFVDDVVF